MKITISKVNNGFFAVVETEGMWVFAHFYELYGFLSQKFDPEDIPLPELPEPPCGLQEQLDQEP